MSKRLDDQPTDGIASACLPSSSGAIVPGPDFVDVVRLVDDALATTAGLADDDRRIDRPTASTPRSDCSGLSAIADEVPLAGHGDPHRWRRVPHLSRHQAAAGQAAVVETVGLSVHALRMRCCSDLLSRSPIRKAIVLFASVFATSVNRRAPGWLMQADGRAGRRQARLAWYIDRQPVHVVSAGDRVFGNARHWIERAGVCSSLMAARSLPTAAIR